jgi:uncharacterized protein (DUF1684 family)
VTLNKKSGTAGKEELQAMIRRLARTGLSTFILGISFAIAGFFAARPAAAQINVTSAESEWRQDLAAWRLRREKAIDAPDGWLTVVGMEWLKTGINSVGTAAGNQIQVHAQGPDHIGLLTVSGTTVQLLAPSGGFPADLTIDGKPAREGSLVVEGSMPSKIAWRGLSLVVLDRGGHYALRIEDNESPTRKDFKGLNWYAPDPQFSVEASWAPNSAAHTEKLPTVSGSTLALPAPGIAEFTLAGRKLTLMPVLETAGAKTLLFIVSDETGKDSTFAGGRYLHAPFPDRGLDKPGKLILDFNRLENSACAYSTYASCPLPPEPNRLPIAIEAGEKRYTP